MWARPHPNNNNNNNCEWRRQIVPVLRNFNASNDAADLMGEQRIQMTTWPSARRRMDADDVKSGNFPRHTFRSTCAPITYWPWSLTEKPSRLVAVCGWSRAYASRRERERKGGREGESERRRVRDHIICHSNFDWMELNNIFGSPRAFFTPPMELASEISIFYRINEGQWSKPAKMRPLNGRACMYMYATSVES